MKLREATNIRNVIKSGLNAMGFDIHRLKPPALPPASVVIPKYDKIHYACYKHYFDGWLNVDILQSGPENYLFVNLTTKHPFPDNSFRFAFSEDFIEHIDQADALVFLAEVYRTLKPGGVLRLSSPGFQAVLDEHFARRDYESVMHGKHAAYEWNGHRHFFTTESLELVARHIGFNIEFFGVGKTNRSEFAGVGVRQDQTCNLYAELTKPSI